MRRALVVIAAAVAVYVLRTFGPTDAPEWLRGTSPFNLFATRAERERCLAFGNMIGSTNPGYAIHGDRDGPVTVSIDRTLRVHDSLVFEGKASRGGRTRLLFHCATANVAGHPGKHKTAASVPWPGHAEDWPSANRLEERMEQQCADSAARVFPTSRISRRWLVLRPLPYSADIRGTAFDTLSGDENDFGCSAIVLDRGAPAYAQFGELLVTLSWPTRDRRGP